PWTCALYPTPVISRLRSYPLVTPWIILFNSARTNPWIARTFRSSLGRVTITLPFSTLTPIPETNVQSNFPRGPLNDTIGPASFTSTPVGIAMGLFPIRDIDCSLVRYHTEHKTSPPSPAWRDSRSVMTPFDVERMETPIPFLTLGISLLPT